MGNDDIPTPGDTVKKETPWDDYNRLNVVHDSVWTRNDDDMYVADDEFVTQARNKLGILGKHSADDVVKEGGQWVIPQDGDS